MEYVDFFRVATGHAPLPYQERFHKSREELTILEIPTGHGKTDAVAVDWLYRRLTKPESTPRRLICCLPGRAPTEQLFTVASARVKNSGMENKVRVCRLMGGSVDNDLTLGPDESAIYVGVQDILISRALNRGYARNPFRWPIDFALLNNDSYWVFDEVQLLGDALATSTQLAAFRNQFGCFGSVECCWMSATFHKEWLDTVDFGGLADSLVVISLNDEDKKNGIVQKRSGASKSLERAPVECRMPSGVADFVIQHHRPGTRSLIVANTVSRAREIWSVLQKHSRIQPMLLHSRFRAADRAAHMKALIDRKPGQDQIVVATQVIEAGIDISASLLVTDIAPYSSLVQRFGRVNRTGDDPDSEIFWVDRPLTDKRKPWANVADLKAKEMEEVSAPYDPQDIEDAVEIIRIVKSAAPKDLPAVKQLPPWQHVIRRADILDLFDTTPDLAGNQIDISRFVRSGHQSDVYVAWRNWGRTEDSPPAKPEITEEELCPVPIGQFREFLKKHRAWSWNSVDGKWEAATDKKIYPGLTILIHASEGGYTSRSGWWPESKDPVPPSEKPGQAQEQYDDERNSYVSYRQSLSDHTDDVCSALDRLMAELALTDLNVHREDMAHAARKHDWGKAHPVMQQTLNNAPPPYFELLAKQKRQDADPKGHKRRHFRHELASALAMTKDGDSDLAAYVVAAHHGRVRMSLRSMPGEREGERKIARGIKENDPLLACDLGDGVLRSEIRLSLEAMLLGCDEDASRSWTDRVLRLRDTLGPFRLAYLEMLLRIADERTSNEAGKRLAT